MSIVRLAKIFPILLLIFAVLVTKFITYINEITLCVDFIQFPNQIHKKNTLLYLMNLQYYLGTLGTQIFIDGSKLYNN